jgi:hypothetical protein
MAAALFAGSIWRTPRPTAGTGEKMPCCSRMDISFCASWLKTRANIWTILLTPFLPRSSIVITAGSVEAYPITIKKFNYGVCCEKLWSPEELAAARERSEAPKNAATAGALKFEQSQADKGDSYWLFHLGERYRDGNGVPKDLDKARDYFEKAKKAGNSNADDELKKLNQAGGQSP